MPFFDEIQNLVEPAERPHMEVRTGLISHGRRGVARTARPTENSDADDGEPGALVDGEEEKDQTLYILRSRSKRRDQAKPKRDAGRRLGAVAPRVGPSKTGLVVRVGVINDARFVR